MSRIWGIVWPRSLAGRLVLLLVVALAIAQLVLILVLQYSHDSTVIGIVRGQALNQTATLARLIETMPAEDADRFASAFQGRGSCAWLSSTPAAATAETPAEDRLADILSRRLQGVIPRRPAVEIDTEGDWQSRCPERAGEVSRSRGILGADGEEEPSSRDDAQEHERPAQGLVTISVPLSGGRWLNMATRVNRPRLFGRVTLLSFLISSLAVSFVTVACVRLQTRSLRSLADASERFGRGEAVGALDVRGPSEVVAATLAFNTMQERLSQFMRDRLRLLAAVSHDLRTPLTTLRLKAEFVDDPDARAGLIATIDELSAICEATLAFTRAEATSEETRLTDLDALCTEVVEEFADAGADAQLTEDRADVQLPCRPIALKRALRNLVDNAVRYGGQALVSISRPSSDTVSIRVEDHGPGLPEDQFEEAFQPFVRLEPSRCTETGGVGLGLAIARSIVKAHGGELTLANRPGGGLKAEILLPTARSMA